MSEESTCKKMIATLRAIQHTPIQRGGNGKLLPLAQLAMLHALGGGWVAEHPIPTKQGRHSGYPTCYKVDIANPDLMIAIEIDGSSHRLLSRKKLDQKKGDLLSQLGWQVFRVSNEKALHLYSTFKSVDTLLTLLTES
jgi:hypothetical protein